MQSKPRMQGQGYVEYALILILVAIAVFLVLTAFGINLNNLFIDISTEI